MQQFEQFVTNNLSLIGVLQGQIVTERLAIWKHEQQQMANGVPKVHSVILDKIQGIYIKIFNQVNQLHLFILLII